jgi:hypothetical protein
MPLIITLRFDGEAILAIDVILLKSLYANILFQLRSFFFIYESFEIMVILTSSLEK